MTHKSEFVAEGYTWVHVDDNAALLRSADNRVERWRVVLDGETVTGRTLRSSYRMYLFVEDVTFQPLPEWGRLDLEIGQMIEIEAHSKWWARGVGHGTIESLYRIRGGVRYRVRLGGVVLASFKPAQVRPFPPSA